MKLEDTNCSRGTCICHVYVRQLFEIRRNAIAFSSLLYRAVTSYKRRSLYCLHSHVKKNVGPYVRDEKQHPYLALLLNYSLVLRR